MTGMKVKIIHQESDWPTENAEINYASNVSNVDEVGELKEIKGYNGFHLSGDEGATSALDASSQLYDDTGYPGASGGLLSDSNGQFPTTIRLSLDYTRGATPAMFSSRIVK